MLFRNFREILLDHTESYLVGQYLFIVTAVRSTNATALVKFGLPKAPSCVMSLKLNSKSSAIYLALDRKKKTQFVHSLLQHAMPNYR
jgi:hypothetical protein